jgi:hypothetical protein
MAQLFLINYLSAFGHVGPLKQWTWDCRDSDLSKPPRALARYLASRRRYGVVEVQPILLPSNPEEDPLAGRLGYEDEWGYISTGRYVIALHETTNVDLLDAIHAAIAMLRQTLDGDDILLIPLEAQDIPITRVLSGEAVDTIARRRLPAHSAEMVPLIAFQQSASHGMHFDDFLWRLCDRLIRRAAFARAALYFRSAIRHVYLINGPVDDRHAWFEEMPARIREQVQIESSIQDCLKVVETLYGGMLSRSETRLGGKLIEIGVNPEEICGFSRPPYAQSTMLQKLLALRDARDSRAAHGTSAEERLNSLYELCDFQHLVSTILWRTIGKGDDALLAGTPCVKPLQLDESLLSPRVRRKLPKKIVRKRRSRVQ